MRRYYLAANVVLLYVENVVNGMKRKIASVQIVLLKIVE